MKKILLLLLVIPGLFITGCKLDAPDFSKIAKSTGTGGGTNTGTDTTTTTTNTNSDSYQPVTKNTYWKYSGVIAGSTETETQTMTGDTAIFNNKTYYAVNVTSTVAGNSTEYYYHGDDNYTMRSTSNGGFTIEYLYLKDNYEIGKTWTSPITDDGTLNSVSAQIVGKIVEQGITKTISGKKFTGVVHTQLLVQYDLGSGFETVQTLDYYIAKGIGIVEADSSSPSGVLSTSAITDYSIK